MLQRMEQVILSKELMMSDSRIIYHKNQNNIGYSSNCNKLISLARGEYVAIFHSDDVYESSIVEKKKLKF